MAITKTIQATVKNRTDTAANWTQKNPVLAEGEIIVVQTSAGETRLKIGDGVKTFTQLPYTDEQIYNNVVTSVNGQTGDITTNSVEYTSQILTDAQKKQARENIDAASDFVVNGTPNQGGTVTLDKTLVQINEAVNSGKNVFARITSGDFIAFMPLTQCDSGLVKFAMAGNDNANVIAAELVVAPNVNSLHINRSPGLNDNRDMWQISMASDPAEPMQIATKKYVDDKISDKELILSSSTVGSTKKFKLTIDDTGTLTASEITA